MSTLSLAPDLALTSCQDIARDYPKVLKTGEMRHLSWYNHIIGYNNYSETILMAVVIDKDGPRVSTSSLATDLLLTNCQDIGHDYPKDFKIRQNEVLCWYNHIIGYNNYSETVLIPLVMD